MSDLDLEDVADFIKQYRELTFPKQFEQFKKDFGDAVKESRLTAPGFNVFRVLKVDRREVKTHSAFLADLLNPTGTHGQGFIFLQAFLDHLHENKKRSVAISTEKCSRPSMPFPMPEGDIESATWQINKELGTSEHGQLDIVLRCPERKFICVIENKISALEGEGQIESYWKWMQTKSDEFPKQALIFLTPEGRRADTAGCATYFSFSYHEDVFKWLEKASPVIKSPVVAGVVNQYMQIALTL